MRYIALLMCLLIQVSVDAQSVRKIIVGRVLDKEATEREEKPIPFDVSSRYKTTRIYYFNTVQEGRKMCEALNQDTVRLISSAKYTVPDSLGFYKVVLSEKGSLVIKVGTASAVLEILENRKEIVTYVETSHHLDEVTVTGKQKSFFYDEFICEDPAPETLIFNNMSVYLPAKLGKNDARLILQPYVVDVSNNRIIKKLRPHVYDGSRYHKKMLRKLGHNNIKDSLVAYIMNEPLTEQAKQYHWTDTFQCPDFNFYQVFLSVKLQSIKQKVYHEKTLPCTDDPRRRRRPMRFLEYSFAPYELNPIHYQEKAKSERQHVGVTEVYRPLTKEEILDRYQNDPDYHSGKKSFTLNEYWHLFNMLKGSFELEELYRRAYKYSSYLNEGKPWVLAANNLAVSYLNRDTVDTNILKPLIDASDKRCNLIRTFDGDIIGVDNVEEVVANQIEMYLKTQDYFKAKKIVGILPDTEKYKLLKSFVLCLNGYYKINPNLSVTEIQRRKEIFELVSNSSLLNKVVMYLAMNGQDCDLIAEEALKNLPVNDTKTFYFKAILYERRGENDMASKQLLECFKRDKEYLMIAKYDGDISVNCYKRAKKEYYEWSVTDKNI